jgi:uncharacterized protein (TIGR04141 family)
VRGLALTDPSDAIDPERGAESVALRTDLPFEARLFVPPSSTGTPDWQRFLEQGSAGPLRLLEGATDGAALLVRVPITEGDRDRWVAFTFGTGRFLLTRQWLERRFGLRAALNLAYPRGEVFTGPVPPRLKTIDARTIDEVTYDTRRRASRSVPLENFGLTVRWDLIGAVEVYPSPNALPFFSRVNLRQHAEDLKTMGLPVSYACVSRR